VFTTLHCAHHLTQAILEFTDTHCLHGSNVATCGYFVKQVQEPTDATTERPCIANCQIPERFVIPHAQVLRTTLI
jgi:hypothetical protein